jgi:hypothetical protein
VTGLSWWPSRPAKVADKVDDVAGRLYGLPLEDFTRERDAAARELRKAKERDAAAVVAKLPKPTQAAWAANALTREHRDLVDELLEAGDVLRDAQQAAVAGHGADALRDAAAAERAAVEALMKVAKDLKPGGRKPTEATLEKLKTTLEAAATDDDVRAALDRGRVVEDAEGAGAWGLLAGADAPAAPPRKPAKKRPPKPASKQEAEDRRAVEERLREERERRQRLEAELREARAERRSRERELERAEKAADRAAGRLEAALAAAEEAREQADEAKAELEAARESASEARDTVARLEEQLD